MRIFQALGTAGSMLPYCRVPDRYQFLTAKGEVLLDFAVLEQAVSGWSETYSLHQPAIEKILRSRLAELGVDIRLSTSFLSLTQDAQGVTTEVEGPQGKSRIRSRYLVACDGASSPVREHLGIGVFDYAFDEPWLVLDTLIEDVGDMPIACRQICDPRRPTTYMAMSKHRFRWEFMIRPGEEPEDLLHDDKIRDLVAPWGCFDRMTIERKAIYRFHGLVANQWRVGRVLLAGDAAHQMPPFAGQGMCSGIRDAANLAWKLADVIEGRPSDLLNSYQTEREPHVRTIIETAIAMGRIVCLLDEDAAAQRDAGMLARKRSGEQDVSVAYPGLKAGVLADTPLAGEIFPQPVVDGERLDDRLGLGPALIGRRLPHAEDVARFDLDEGALAPFAPALTAWLDQVGGQAVLVRPDRYMFGIGDPQALLQAWRSHMAQKTAA
jgi:3-(3-hydroxy-phenyl)propionate hydroxylase